MAPNDAAQGQWMCAFALHPSNQAIVQLVWHAISSCTVNLGMKPLMKAKDSI